MFPFRFELTGNLALSRAIGDFEFKQNKNLSPEAQVVTANPDILVHQITAEDEFLILACDGSSASHCLSLPTPCALERHWSYPLFPYFNVPVFPFSWASKFSGIWDVYSNQQVVDRVRRLLGERKTLEQVAEQMIDYCLAPDCEWGGVGCDNMTFMVVAILGGKTKEQWYDMISERLERGEGYQTPSTFPQPYARGPRGEMLMNNLNQGSLTNGEDEATPPSYQNSENPADGGSPPGNNAPSAGSLFSLAPVSIIEALSRVSNVNSYDPTSQSEQPTSDSSDSTSTDKPESTTTTDAPDSSTIDSTTLSHSDDPSRPTSDA
jgi:protein phosphatase 2C family protein 2/3